MGVGVQVGDISLVEDLKHVVRVAYLRGTNDADLLRRDTEPNQVLARFIERLQLIGSTGGDAATIQRDV